VIISEPSANRLPSLAGESDVPPAKPSRRHSASEIDNLRTMKSQSELIRIKESAGIRPPLLFELSLHLLKECIFKHWSSFLETAN
jgi:hypothetical protein